MEFGAGISMARTNILGFTDLDELNRRVTQELAIKRTFPYSINSYMELVEFLHPYVESREKAEQFAKIHFDERGNITDSGWVVFGKYQDKPQQCIVVLDHGGFLNKKIGKGFLALANSRKFLEPPGISSVVIDDESPRIPPLGKDILAFRRYMEISSVLHRAWIIKRLAKVIPFKTEPIQYINNLDGFNVENSYQREIQTSE